MKKIEFKKASAKNFMCFGDKSVEISFSNYNNIVLIKGINLDTAKADQNAKDSSNGAGKSSIPEIIVYGLYGQTIKSPKKVSTKDVINNKTGKGMVVEVCWDDYRVERKRKPDSLRLWKGDEELTLGGMPATQKLIEDIIGLNYHTFVNVVVFTDDNSNSFLECNAAEKRSIIENLLSLEKYKTYHENAKALVKQHTANLKVVQSEISVAENALKSEKQNKLNLETNNKKWKTDKVNEINNIGKEIEITDKFIIELGNSTDVVRYETVQQQIKELTEEIEIHTINLEKLKPSVEKFEKVISDLTKDQKSLEESKHSLNLEKAKHISDIKQVSEVIQKLNSLEPGVKCNHCYGEIKAENYAEMKVEHQKLGQKIKNDYDIIVTKIKAFDEEIKKLVEDLSNVKKQLVDCNKKISSINNEINSHRNQISTLSKIKVPDNSLKIAGLVEKKKILQQQVEEKKNQLDGISPYDNLMLDSETKILELESNLTDRNNKYDEIKEKEQYFEFWKVAFGDTGIRKYVLDEIIPALNDNLNYWLQFLIDGKLQIEFDNTLEEKISKFPNDDKPLIYHILSNGQRRRINLALSQAFAHIMSLNTGKSPGLVFLDEVSSNIDAVGIESIYAMICELSKEKMVFVTTHDENLLEMLNGCSEIQLQMKNGITNLV
jgi:DNA repair exonuclease SbcCD ATPase subunit